MIDAGVAELAPVVGVKGACAGLGRSRASWYRRRRPRAATPSRRRGRDPRALSAAERHEVMAVLHSERFCDQAPPQVWATLLDEGRYLCSISTMYRLLRAHGEVRERRALATHPARVRPELLATGPNQVWSWDITKLRGPQRWVWFHLYVILDVFSRYVVGWLVAPRESATLAEALIADAVAAQAVGRDQLTVHADRGTSMTSRPVAWLLAELGIARSHCRPHVPNDNPYSEAAFKTLKYCPAFPRRFAGLAAARSFCAGFFAYYNDEHRHSSLGLHTPADVHHGRAAAVRQARAVVLEAAYAAHPERFRCPPHPPALPTAAWINRPDPPITTVRQLPFDDAEGQRPSLGARSALGRPGSRAAPQGPSQGDRSAAEALDSGRTAERYENNGGGSPAAPLIRGPS